MTSEKPSDTSLVQAVLLFADDTMLLPAPVLSLAAKADPFLHFLRRHGIVAELAFRRRRPAFRELPPPFQDTGRPVYFEEDICAAGGVGPFILRRASRMECPPDRLLVASARQSEIQAAASAGALAAWLDGRLPAESIASKGRIFRMRDLDALRKFIRLRIPMPPGKFPADLLKAYLDDGDIGDPAVLIPPGIGEDTAAVDMTGEEVLILKSDPITFAADAIGQYAVIVNANDIATSGALPRWLLATLLFPVGTTPLAALRVMTELRDVCRKWGITLCGGHTEITDAVNRTVVTGLMAGTVRRSELRDKSRMAAGDVILLTKSLAVEGTAILAREFAGRLRNRGVSEAEIQEAAGLLSLISILDEAAVASRSREVVAMHDVTEGGLAAALLEFSISGKHRIDVDMDRIPVHPLSRRLCMAMDIDPLGLIGSGSLLIGCRPQGCDPLIREIEKAGIDVTRIGRVGEPGQGIRAFRKGYETPWPRFEADEIARLFSA